MAQMNFTRKPAVAKMAAIQTALTIAPLSQNQLAEAVNASSGGLRPYIAELRRTKQIYIHAWDGVTCKYPVWKWGNKKDKKKPPRKTAIQRARKYKKRLFEEDPDKFFMLRARSKGRRHKTPLKKQSWMVICA